MPYGLIAPRYVLPTALALAALYPLTPLTTPALNRQSPRGSTPRCVAARQFLGTERRHKGIDDAAAAHEVRPGEGHVADAGNLGARRADGEQRALLNQAYGALGKWADANGYRIVGPGRELYLHLAQPVSRTDESNVTEMQFPVEKA